jgi:ssDNA-binding replication factor A large subunit
MSSKQLSSNEVSVDKQGFEQAEAESVEDDQFPVGEETPEFRPTVEQEIQAKVDANHPDGIVVASNDRIHGVTLEQEERIKAREAELERISVQAEMGRQAGRERQSRAMARERSKQRRASFQKRAASVDPMADPELEDPRAGLLREELAAVNEQAKRLADAVDGWSRAAIARLLGEAVAGGRGVTSAVVRLINALETSPGGVVPIGRLEDVDRKEVSIAGRVETLWEPSHPSIAQVGLLADASGQTRLTVWKASKAPWMREGERVRIHEAARNWYEGRVSLAVTGRTKIHFPDRDRWWA